MWPKKQEWSQRFTLGTLTTNAPIEKRQQVSTPGASKGGWSAKPQATKIVSPFCPQPSFIFGTLFFRRVAQTERLSAAGTRSVSKTSEPGMKLYSPVVIYGVHTSRERKRPV